MSNLAKRIEHDIKENQAKANTLLDTMTELKQENIKISRYYYKLYEKSLAIGNVLQSNYYKKKSEQLKNCANTMIQVLDDSYIPPKEYYLTFFCKSRLCPICIHKLSKQTFKLITDIVNHPKAKDYSYLFMTLTIKNCKAEELPATIDKLLKAYTKLISNKRTQFSKRFKGTFRVLESTYNYKNKTYHPHLHVLIMIDKSYFKEAKKYLTKDKLIEVWQKVLNVDYRPSVDIRKTYDAQAKTVAEVSKYTVKSSEVVNPEVLAVYDNAFKGRRLRSFTGDFKTIKAEVLKQWEAEKNDGVSYTSLMTNESFTRNLYKWDFFSNSFQLKQSNKDDLQKIQNENYVSSLVDTALNTDLDYIAEELGY